MTILWIPRSSDKCTKATTTIEVLDLDSRHYNYYSKKSASHYILNVPLCNVSSGVVGRERMGTAFPHKKLSANGVPTRGTLRDIFLLLLLN